MPILASICSKIGSGATPRGGKSAYLPIGPVALIRSQNILNDRFSKDGLAYIDEKQADALKNVTVEKGDVLLNITGDSVARVCAVDPTVLPARVNQHVAIIRPKSDGTDADFIRYFLVSPEAQNLLLALASQGATRNALTKSMIESFRIPDIGLEEQQAIGRFFRTLDDKIELNRQMNETLEAMARALFQDWFVDFGPTRRKQAGETDPLKILGQAFPDPSRAAEIAVLFPDVTGEDGLPVGWVHSTIGTLTRKVTKGTTPRKSDLSCAENTEQVPFYRVVNLSNEGKLLNNSVQKIPLDIHLGTLRRSILDAGDILYSIAGTIGRVCKLEKSEIPANVNQALAILRPDDSKITSNFLLLWLKRKSFHDELHSNVVQAVQANLSLGMISNAPVIAPPAERLRKIMEPIDQLMDMSSGNEQENQTLAQTRDLLLPKLMSGEIHLQNCTPNPSEKGSIS